MQIVNTIEDLIEKRLHHDVGDRCRTLLAGLVGSMVLDDVLGVKTDIDDYDDPKHTCCTIYLLQWRIQAGAQQAHTPSKF